MTLLLLEKTQQILLKIITGYKWVYFLTTIIIFSMQEEKIEIYEPLASHSSIGLL